MSLTTPSTNPLNQFRINEGTLREGIPVEKGVVLTQEFLEQNEKLIGDYCNYFLRNPDLFLDTIKSKECPINFFYYQRILLRAMMRYRFFFGTFTRGTSKSFIAILSQYLSCIFLPGSKRFLVSQFKKASLDITKAKLEEIWTWFPILKNELESWKMSTDYIELKFKNRSLFQILTLSASARGQRATGGVMEEAALIDGQVLNEVILPMMSVPRRGPNGLVDPDEPHQQQIYITSAGAKTTFAYERLVEMVVQEIVDPSDVFVCGSSYELPVHYGLLDKKFLNEMKMSSNFDEASFQRENASVWTGASSQAWFNSDKLIKSRKLLVCERKAKPEAKHPDAFYVIGVDVARTGNNDSSVMVIKVYPNDSVWKKKVVYTENLTKMMLPQQAARIKELNELYQPRDIVVDANGIGHGLVDELVLPSVGPKGQQYGPLYVSNDPDNYPVPRGQKAIVYNIKATAQLNNEIYSNLYVQFNSGNVSLLANERIAKEKLLSTKKGQRMNLYQREKFLLPYIMTSRLIDEINNLKLKPTGAANQLAVEQISTRINKDRVSAISYALFRIKYYEDKAIRRAKRGGAGQMMFFSPGTTRSR